VTLAHLHHASVAIIIIIIFLPSVDMFPREFKNSDIQNWVQIYQSVQSGVIIIIIIFFDPGTQFPREEKITLCNIKKVQKSSWNEPYSSSSFTKQSCSKMALYR